VYVLRPYFANARVPLARRIDTLDELKYFRDGAFCRMGLRQLAA
jgi:hypothetical protein